MDGVSAAPQSSLAHTTRRVRRDMYAEGPSPIRADPSGTVVDAATGEPVPGARVTLWYAPLPGVDPEPWDASPWGQENPLATDGGGRFAYCSFFGVTFRSPSVYRSISHRCVLACGTGADGAHDRVHTGDFAVLGLT